jgi:acyl-CoA reductase-like NAD-dependent aldehyde dehydrogenase
MSRCARRCSGLSTRCPNSKPRPTSPPIFSPIGGIGHSGTGVQAGGPDDLKQFMWTRAVGENTLQHGFVPPDVNE